MDQALFLSPFHYRFFKQGAIEGGESLTNLRTLLTSDDFFCDMFMLAFGVGITQACLDRERTMIVIDWKEHRPYTLRRYGALGFVL